MENCPAYTLSPAKGCPAYRSSPVPPKALKIPWLPPFLSHKQPKKHVPFFSGQRNFYGQLQRHALFFKGRKTIPEFENPE
jgi:hypothetical protein